MRTVHEYQEEADQAEQQVIRAFLAQREGCGYEELFHVFYPRAIRFFRTRGIDPETCEDLTQNVFLLVFRSVEQVRDPLKFRAWLFRIIRNEWLQHHRRLKAFMRAGHPEPLSDHDDLPDTGCSPHLAAEVVELLQPLSEQDREIVRLHFFDGLAYREIAELLDTAVGTVKWRIFQIRLKLAETNAAAAAGSVR